MVAEVSSPRPASVAPSLPSLSSKLSVDVSASAGPLSYSAVLVLTLPPGKLGVRIREDPEDGRCVVFGKSNVFSPLEVGDVIECLHGENFAPNSQDQWVEVLQSTSNVPARTAVVRRTFVSGGNTGKAHSVTSESTNSMSNSTSKADQVAAEASAAFPLSPDTPNAVEYFTRKAAAKDARKRFERRELALQNMSDASKHFDELELEKKALRAVQLDDLVNGPRPAAVEFFTAKDIEAKNQKRLALERAVTEPPPVAIDKFTKQARQEKEMKRAMSEELRKNPPPMSAASQHFKAREIQMKEDKERAIREARERARDKWCNPNERPSVDWGSYTSQRSPSNKEIVARRKSELAAERARGSQSASDHFNKGRQSKQSELQNSQSSRATNYFNSKASSAKVDKVSEKVKKAQEARERVRQKNPNEQPSVNWASVTKQKSTGVTEEQKKLAAEHQKKLAAERQKKLEAERQRKIAAEKQRLLDAEIERIRAERAASNPGRTASDHFNNRAGQTASDHFNNKAGRTANDHFNNKASKPARTANDHFNNKASSHFNSTANRPAHTANDHFNSKATRPARTANDHFNSKTRSEQASINIKELAAKRRRELEMERAMENPALSPADFYYSQTRDEDERRQSPNEEVRSSPPLASAAANHFNGKESQRAVSRGRVEREARERARDENRLSIDVFE